MTNQLTDIQSQIESFLQTDPEHEVVNSLINRLKEYELDRQRQAVKADLAWKEQLPDTFPEYPKDKGLREKFRRIYNQLNSQGVSVTYSADYCDLELMQWLLDGNGEKGRLILYKRSQEWAMHGIKMKNSEGNLLPEFNYIYYGKSLSHFD